MHSLALLPLLLATSAFAGLPETFTYQVNTAITTCNYKNPGPGSCTLDKVPFTLETIELKAPKKKNESSFPATNPTVKGEKEIEIALADGRAATFNLIASVDAVTGTRLTLNVGMKLLSVTGQRNSICGATAMQIVPKAKKEKFSLIAIAHCVNPQDHDEVTYLKMEIENAK